MKDNVEGKTSGRGGACGITHADQLLSVVSEAFIKVDLKNPEVSKIVEVAIRQVNTAKNAVYNNSKIVSRISQSLQQLSRVEPELMEFIDSSTGTGDAKASVDNIVEQLLEAEKILIKLASVLAGSK